MTSVMIVEVIMDIKLTININTDNSAFDDYNKELKRILDTIVFKVVKYSESLCSLREEITDINGNNVGEWSYEEISDE